MLTPKFYVLLFFAAFLAFMISCSDDDNALTNNTESQAAEERALQIVPGTVIETERETEHGIEVFEIKIQPASGGVVKVKIAVGTGDLVEMKGDEGPFTYEITPGNGFLTFSQARGLALAARSGELLEWKLERDESDARWEYRFEVRESGGAEIELRLDAVTGEILEVKES